MRKVGSRRHRDGLTRRDFLKASGGLLFGAGALGFAGCERGETRTVKGPNILFLMTDQHRFDALGSVIPLVKTPNLDRLASRGVRYSQAVCNAPMCVPSRYSMMTGLYPSQVGVRHNTQMIPTDEGLPVPVIAQRLLEAGYQTAGFGKTHWYMGENLAPNAGVKPSRRGFEVRAMRNTDEPGRVEPGAAQMGDELPEAFAALQRETAPFGSGETIPGYKGLTSSVPPEKHTEAWLVDEALDFLENGRDGDRPFFLYLSFDFPHASFNVPPGYEALYDLEDMPPPSKPPPGTDPSGHAEPWQWQEWLARTTEEERRRTTLRYFALCTYADEQLGRVLDRIEETGQADNTFVVFVSDHGEMLGDRHRFSKYCLYDPSVRVPMIVAGAGVPERLRGTTDDRPAELIDVLPTLLSVAGGSKPPELPGRSLLAEPTRSGAFCEMHGTGYEPREQAPAYMWRTRDWKLITYTPGTAAASTSRAAEARGELYDLRNDPDEFDNLYGDPAHLDTQERLQGDLLMHLAGAWSKFPRRTSKSPL
jgi:arylsulfatase A-like enzyme